MRPFLSGSGTSNQRTRMLLEVVAKADTLVGPQEGTGKQRQQRGEKPMNDALFAVYLEKNIFVMAHVCVFTV